MNAQASVQMPQIQGFQQLQDQQPAQGTSRFTNRKSSRRTMERESKNSLTSAASNGKPFPPVAQGPTLDKEEVRTIIKEELGNIEEMIQKNTERMTKNMESI